ncbi:unnamed protein product [Orchesella dallaii]|uniref:Uncharacterized protein n=1 Tax=Orchesella dallaii TaxID=48710 RepID=A0ABP1PSY5_9HEXA
MVSIRKQSPASQILVSAFVLSVTVNLVQSRSAENLRIMRLPSSVTNSSDQQSQSPAVVRISRGTYNNLEHKNYHPQPQIQLSTWSQQGLKPMPMKAYYRKKKVDTQKFRECIFFQLCPKTDCFHYGRFSKCA